MYRPKLHESEIPTFESHQNDHKSCPSAFVHWNDEKGWCDLHDEWWKLPMKLEDNDLGL